MEQTEKAAQDGMTLGEAVTIRTVGPEVLGRVYRDKSSAFAGRCIALTFGLYDPPALCLQPAESKDGALTEAKWLPLSRCEEVG